MIRALPTRPVGVALLMSASATHWLARATTEPSCGSSPVTLKSKGATALRIGGHAAFPLHAKATTPACAWLARFDRAWGTVFKGGGVTAPNDDLGARPRRVSVSTGHFCNNQGV